MDFKEFVLLKEAGKDEDILDKLAPLKSRGAASNKGKSKEDVEQSKKRIIVNSNLAKKIADKIAEYFSTLLNELEPDSREAEIINELGLNDPKDARYLAEIYLDILYPMLYDENGNLHDLHDKQEIGNAIANVFSEDKISPFQKAIFAVVMNILRTDRDPENQWLLLGMLDKVIKYLSDNGMGVSLKNIYNNRNELYTNDKIGKKKPRFDPQELIQDIFLYMNRDSDKSAMDEIGLPIDDVSSTVMGSTDKEDVSDEEDILKKFPKMKNAPHKDELMRFAKALTNVNRHVSNSSNDAGYTSRTNAQNDAALSTLSDFLDTESITPKEALLILELLAQRAGVNGVYAGSFTRKGGDRGNIISKIIDNIGNDAWDKIKHNAERIIGSKFEQDMGNQQSSSQKVDASFVKNAIDIIQNASKTSEIQKWVKDNVVAPNKKITDDEYGQIVAAAEERAGEDPQKPLSGRGIRGKYNTQALVKPFFEVYRLQQESVSHLISFINNYLL